MNTETTIDISHLDKGSVLAALYNASRPLGMGFMHFDPKPMTPGEGTEILKERTYFDYLKGRVMKLELKGDNLDPWGYDRDNGIGAAKRAIDALRTTGDVNAFPIQETQKAGTRQSASNVRAALDKPSTFETKDGIPVMTMGLADVADELGPKVNEAIKHANQ